ncbi:ATP-binding cassette domain-containing protein [Asanoa iriomotensis]|uniref:ATP-binding cassette domain-containing protein n=1 Tax=Asanoa iriomotensis TaxID=234613 RepID=UPI00194194D3|nr:ATP-binding cassette domain-containing protein [Asanoa iriomotensis]
MRAPSCGLLDVSFTVDAGHHHAVVVPHTSGTALLEIIAGTAYPDHGQVYLAGQPVAGRPASELIRHNVGYLPVTPRWHPGRTVVGVLEAAVRWQMLYRRQATALTGREQITDVVDRCNLGALADAESDRLAPQWARMLDLAVILLHRPRLILVDQPMTGPGEPAASFRQAITDLPDTVAALFAVPTPSDAAGLADRVTVISHGRTSGHPEPGTAQR